MKKTLVYRHLFFGFMTLVCLVDMGSVQSWAGEYQPLPTPLTVNPVSKAQWNKETPELSYQGIYSANLSGDKAWILDTFPISERAGVQSRMTVDALVRNRQYHQNLKKVTVLGKKPYKSYMLLRVREDAKDGSSLVLNIPMVKTASGWLLTNKLMSDPGFDPVEEMLKGGPSAPPRKKG